MDFLTVVKENISILKNQVSVLFGNVFSSSFLVRFGNFPPTHEQAFFIFVGGIILSGGIFFVLRKKMHVFKIKRGEKGNIKKNKAVSKKSAKLQKSLTAVFAQQKEKELQTHPPLRRAFSLLSIIFLATLIGNLPEKYRLADAYQNWQNQKARQTSGAQFSASLNGMAMVAGESQIKNNLPLVLAATDIATNNIQATANPNAKTIQLVGTLADTDGKMVNGTHSIRFAIYDSDRTTVDPYPSDTDKNQRIWEEVQSVDIKNGVFNVELGKINNLPTTLAKTNTQFYLAMRVENDSEMVPRKKIGPSFFALNSENAITLNGKKIGNQSGDIPILNQSGQIDIQNLPTGNGKDQLVTGNDKRFTLSISGQKYFTISGQTFKLNKIDLNSNTQGTLSVGQGGTGLTNFSQGDLLYASGTDALAGLTIGTNGQILTINNGIPAWKTINLGDSLLGTLPIANGGTGNTTFSAGSVVFSDGTKLTENNANFFWDSVNSRFGIGNNSPVALFSVGTASQFQVDSSGNVSATTYTGNAVSAGTYNGNIISTGTGTLNLGANVLILTGNVNLNQNLLTTDTPIFAGMTLNNGNLILSGTSTITIASTNLIANLNADMADGYHFNQGLLITDAPQFSGMTLTGVSGVLKAMVGVISGSATTSDLPEGTNLYYTDARARGAISSTISALDYSASTGKFSLLSNFVIPTVAEETNWNDAYNRRVTTWNAPLSFASNAASFNFNAINLKIDSGALNTAQNISLASSPTFAGVTLNGNLTLASGGTIIPASTNLIANLNADMADGYHFNQSLLITDAPQFSGMTLNNGNLILSGTSTITIASTNLIANLNADMADGYHFNQGLLITSNPTFASLTLTAPLSVANGGTGFYDYAMGNLLYATNATTLAKLTIGSEQQVLTSVGGVPVWTTLSLSSGVTSVLPIANGGTGNTAFSAGSVVFSDGTKLTENNANFFWDNVNARLGIGTTTPTEKLEVAGNVKISANLTADSVSANSLIISGQATLGATGQNINVNSSIIPATTGLNLGSSTNHWANLYVDNMTVASTDLSGTSSQYFTINTGAVSENTMGLQFYRGATLNDYAALVWDSSIQAFKLYKKENTSTLGDLNASALNVNSIYSSGNVGIGTATPAALLSVGSTSQFQVNASGNITAVAFNGNTISAGTGTLNLGAYILTLTDSNVSLNQDLLKTSSPTFAGATITGTSGILKATVGVISGSATTSDLPEGTNLYYTNTRARGAISSTATELVYTTATGAFSLNSNNIIPTLAEETNWNDAYNRRVTTWNAPFVFAGNALTLNYNTTNLKLDTANALSTIQDIAITSSPTFASLNLTNSLTVSSGGTGANTFSANYVLKGNGTSALSSSIIYDNGTNVGIGTTSPGAKLQINADANYIFPTPGTTKGSLHITPVSGLNGYSSAITFGANSLGTVYDSAQAGIYVQSSGGYGAQMYFATTDNFTTGAKARMIIDATGNVGIGTTAPTSKLNILSLTEQMRLGYDTNNYWSNAVDSTGTLTMTGVGSRANFKLAFSSVSATDFYDNQTKVASLAGATISNGKLKNSLSCGTYTVTGLDGLTYGTVIGADGKCWLDRNLGATQVATSSTDTASYGSYYQWGRGVDGHQVPTSATTATLSSTDSPGNGYFILAPNTPNDWRSPQNENLWQGVSGVNNPCPVGFRLPTQVEWSALVSLASITNSVTAYNSSLKLPLAGYRSGGSAALGSQGSYGFYWSSSPNGTDSYYLGFTASGVGPAGDVNRAFGFSVRCVKD